MINIFGNFRLTSLEEKQKIEELEKKYKNHLPPIFKVFCQSFIINSLKADKDHQLYHPDEELGFEKFDYNLDQLMKYYLEVGEPHITKKMMPIATSAIHSGGICICLEGENQDKVYINDDMSSEQFVLIAQNIFDFISQLKQFNFLES